VKFFVDVTDAGVRAVQFAAKSRKRPARFYCGDVSRRWRATVQEELRAYFSGRLRSFSVPCDLGTLPFFTRKVLRVTARIPYGEVRSYQWIADRLGKPKATRAVGNALARNPIPFVIPCHRVIRSDGSLGGFALGLDWKKKLLALEKSYR